MESPRSEGRATVVSRTTRVDVPAPRALLPSLSAPRTLWDPPEGPTVIAGGAAATLAADGPDRFAAIREAATDLFADADVATQRELARPRLFGGFAFHDDAGASATWDGFPAARFVLPRVQVIVDDDQTWLTVNAVGPAATPDAVADTLAAERDRLAAVPESGRIADPPGVTGCERTTGREDWRESVTDAIERIHAGELRKVVLAQALDVDLAGDLSVPDVLARLDGRYPDCHRFLVEPAAGGSAFVGATPERLLSLRGRTVETGALAGTTGRGETPAEDEWLAEELLASEKNRHEHDLVAEAIRDQLAPLAASISTGETGIRRLATVQHLWTPIGAELAGDEHVLSLVEALHPTPAVGGLPPDEALATIRETERFERGWYAAPIGWVDADGDGSFAVALRSAVATDRTATLFAGVGVVADSDPDAEWDEVELKFRPILDALEGDED